MNCKSQDYLNIYSIFYWISLDIPILNQSVINIRHLVKKITNVSYLKYAIVNLFKSFLLQMSETSFCIEQCISISQQINIFVGSK